MANSPLSQSELTRYSRHLLLPEVGIKGQERLKKARVLVVGAGGLGSPVIQYLAAAGIGTIGIVDFDTVDLSNLQRQVLYGTSDVGAPKIACAADRVRSMNPEINVESHELRFSEDNAMELVSEYDLIVDGTDNFASRYLVNDACILAGKPNVHGAIYRFEGQVSVFGFEGGPCYRCIFPEPPPPDAVPNCAEGGVLGVMAGVVGTIQATEAIKIILGRGNVLSERLLVYDALEATFQTVKLNKGDDCPLCGNSPAISRPVEMSCDCAQDGQGAVAGKSVSPVALNLELKAGEPLTLVDVRMSQEVELCKIGGAKHIPLPELVERASELDSNQNIVVYCKSGVRSKKAAMVLETLGFARVRNLEGGILAWAEQVDSAMIPY